MTQHILDHATWPRAGAFAFFRSFERPHYAVTVRLNADGLLAGKARGVSVYRASLYAIATGLHAVPELRMRFREDEVTLYDHVDLSMTVPRDDGTFGFAYLPYDPDFKRFDADAIAAIDQARRSDTVDPQTHRNDLAYLSCLPWLDFTAVDNALPHARDCIPRVSWGKIVPEAGGHRMAMAIQVHHALVDGAHLGGFFEAVQTAIDAI